MYLNYQYKKSKTPEEINKILGIKNRYKKVQRSFMPKEIYKLNLEQSIFLTTLNPF